MSDDTALNSKDGLRTQVKQLRADNERLRGLLKGVVDDMVIGGDWEHLLSKINKEVGDEA